MGEPCPAPLRVAMRSPLPFPCVPDRPYKILLVQVGTLSFSHPSFGVSVVFIYPSLSSSHPSFGVSVFFSFFSEPDCSSPSYHTYIHATAVRQAAPKPPRAAAGLGVMLRHSFGDGSPSLGCCIGGESPPLVSSFPFFLFF